MIKDFIILILSLLILVGVSQWMIYFIHKSIEAIKDAREAWKEYKKAEKACEDCLKDLDSNNKICYTYSRGLNEEEM